MSDGSSEQPKMTAGLDLGDKYSYLCLLDSESGEVIEEGRLRTTPRPSDDSSLRSLGLVPARDQSGERASKTSEQSERASEIEHVQAIQS
jgi:hypothetical protein